MFGLVGCYLFAIPRLCWCWVCFWLGFCVLVAVVLFDGGC